MITESLELKEIQEEEKRSRDKNIQVSKNIKNRSCINSKLTKKITKMIIVSSLLHVIGEVPFSVFFNLILFGLANSTVQELSRVSIFFLYLSPTIDIFVYAIFNRHYRTVFWSYSREVLRVFSRKKTK